MVMLSLGLLAIMVLTFWDLRKPQTPTLANDAPPLRSWEIESPAEATGD